MADDRFASLLDAFCALCSPEDAARVRETREIRIDGVEFSLVYLEEFNSELLFVLCQLGPFDQVDEKLVYRRMLEINFLTIYHFGPQMAIDPETGMAYQITPLPLAGVTAEKLMADLRQTAPFTKQWRGGQLAMPASPDKKVA